MADTNTIKIRQIGSPIRRDREPCAYWLLMSIGFAVFIYFVINGRHMPLR